MASRRQVNTHNVVLLRVVSYLEELWYIIDEAEGDGERDEGLLPGKVTQGVNDRVVPMDIEE